MQLQAVFVLTLVVLSYAVVSGQVKRWYIAPAMIFTIFGIVIGSFGFGIVTVSEHAGSFTVLAQLALTVILFNQASALDVSTAFRRGHLTMRLLAIGIPVTVALGTATALLLMPMLPVAEAVCLAVVVAPTEVALIDALLEDRRIPQRVRHTLSTESGFYDGFALAALLAAIAVASHQADQGRGSWVWFAIRTELVSVAVGAVIGLVGALVIARSFGSGWMSETWAQLATLALAIVCFTVGEELHASGFVTAFAGGLAFALVSPRKGERAANTEFSDATGQLLELLVFALLGAFAVIPAWRAADWHTLLFAALAIFAVRLLAVLVALLRSDLPVIDRLFIGWFGPRGIGTLVLGLLVIEQGSLTEASLIGQTAVVTVTLSLVMHSATAPVGIRLHQRRAATTSPPPPAQS